MSPATQALTVVDIRYLLRARNTLFWVVTSEERRAEHAVAAAVSKEGYIPRFWDCAAGVVDLFNTPISLTHTALPPVMPQAVLEEIRAQEQRTVWILRDLHDHLLDPTICRVLRTAARELQDQPNVERHSAIFVLSSSAEVPINLRSAAVVIDWPLPAREEIASILEDTRRRIDAPPIPIHGTVEEVIDAASGLAAEEVAAALARSIVQYQRIEPSLVTAEKKRIIDRERIVTWYEPDPRGLAAVGGLGRLKAWLELRKLALSQEARAFKLPAPKGILLVGVPGCGKSLMAKALPAAWKIPLLRLDFGALKGSLVGQSEANIRRALRIAEACAPVALWLDELEKALAGSSSAGDSGVAADQLGTILTWLQERAGRVFVVATANDISALPPELVRKGRFDEVFFVDLPTRSERISILDVALRQHDREPNRFDLAAIAAQTLNFSGAEVAALVPSALFRAFAESARDLTSADLLAAAQETVPFANNSDQRIAALRSWAASRAQRASDPEPETTASTSTALPVAPGSLARRLSPLSSPSLSLPGEEDLN